mgnify:FL=1
MSDRNGGVRGWGRDANLRALLDRLAEAGPRSRRDLARDLGLSLASVSRMAEALMAAGLVAESEKVGSGRGRPHALLALRGEAAVVVGVSVRSVSVRLRLATLAGEVLHAARVDRVQGPAEDLVAQLRSLVVAASGSRAAGRPVAAVVVGISGAWDAARARVLAAPNLPTLEGVDLGAALQAGLGDLVLGGSVALDNDVNLAALGEQARGAARGVSDFYYVSLGSGVGGAAVLEGRLRRGAHGLTGELGYLPVGPAGASVPLESVIGRKPLEQWVRERRRAAAPTAATAAAARPGGPTLAGRGASAGAVSPDPDPAHGDVFALLASDDEEFCEHVAGHVAVALAGVTVALDPELIVLGGGMSRRGDGWTERVRRHLGALVPHVPEVAASQLGRDASLLGAIAHATELGRAAMVAHHFATPAT